MSDNSAAPHRFYKAVSVGGDDGRTVLLDGRRVRTPAGAPLSAPTLALAQMLAAEWEAQGEHILTATMPAVRLASTALDRVSQTHAEVAEEVARYAGSDVLCYMAGHPRSLHERQETLWGAWLSWAKNELGIELKTAVGVGHVAQPPQSLDRARELAAALDDFALTALAHATAMLGSAILAFALQRGALDGEQAFAMSQLDEDFQIAQWGLDEEAAQRRAAMLAEARVLDAWFRALEG